MRCDICNTNKADIHSLEKIQGKWVQRSFCEQCAHGNPTGAGMVPPNAPEGASKAFQFFGQILAQSMNNLSVDGMPGVGPAGQPGQGAAEQGAAEQGHAPGKAGWQHGALQDRPEGSDFACPGCGMSFSRFQ